MDLRINLNKSSYKGGSLCISYGYLLLFINLRQYMNTFSDILTSYPSCYASILKLNVNSATARKREHLI